MTLLASRSHLFDFIVAQREMANSVAGMDFSAFQCDNHVAVLFTVLQWPVLVTFSL